MYCINKAICFFSDPFIALAISQICGLLVILTSLDSDKQIVARSGTYWDFNPHMLRHLISNNYDQKIGLFIVTLPTIFQATNDVPFWSNYICLIIGFFLRFTSIRTYFVTKRQKKIKDMIEQPKVI